MTDESSDNPPDSERSLIFQQLDRCATFPYSRDEYARRFAWEWVQRVLVRPSPRRAYRWRRVWLRRFGAKVTTSCRTRPSTRIMHPWLLSLGEHTSLADDVLIYNLGPITIGSHTVVSQAAYLCAGTHDYARPDLPLQRSTIRIGQGVWICTGAFVGPDVTIADNAVVGARAVVTKDVPPNVVVAGNPAQVVKARPMPTEC